ncbi:MAG: MFS transporter [Polyangiaceae bacterium]
MAATVAVTAGPAIEHSKAFKTRRFLNWFPMGLTYALLYMGRYNLTVAQTSLGKTQLMTKEDFGVIFGAGAVVYALSFLLNGPLVDRLGGRFGILMAAFGSFAANLTMALYLRSVLGSATPPSSVVYQFSVLYGVNMYFQSFGAVSIVKVNAHWFHVRERGGFSGIFGTMIASGIFLAFTVNDWVLGLAEKRWGDRVQWVVFAGPAVLLAIFGVIESLLLRNKPSDAGLEDFDTGDASSGDKEEKPIPTLTIFKKLFTNPVILTVAFIEFCTGVLRNGVMHWFPIYVKEVWALPKDHPLVNGSWSNLGVIGVLFGVAAVSFVLASMARGQRRAVLIILGSLAFLAPFLQGGWGGLLMVAGVIGGNVAGWVSDLFFQSRRGPTAAGLYGFLALCTIGMTLSVGEPKTVVDSVDPPAKDKPQPAELETLKKGDEITKLAGKDVHGWADVNRAFACWPAACKKSGWDASACVCSTSIGETPAPEPTKIPATVMRDGRATELALTDPKPVMQAGDKRTLAAHPVLPMTPFALGIFVFLISLSVIGTHGVLSGTATMDFGGRKAAGTAVGMIDGFVYLGTSLQSVVIGYLTTRKGWSYWPPFLIPFAVIGFLLCLRIWNAKPKSGGGH